MIAPESRCRCEVDLSSGPSGFGCSLCRCRRLLRRRTRTASLRKAGQRANKRIATSNLISVGNSSHLLSVPTELLPHIYSLHIPEFRSFSVFRNQPTLDFSRRKPTPASVANSYRQLDLVMDMHVSPSKKHWLARSEVNFTARKPGALGIGIPKSCDILSGCSIRSR
jgi:hypothetical protein